MAVVCLALVLIHPILWQSVAPFMTRSVNDLLDLLQAILSLNLVPLDLCCAVEDGLVPVQFDGFAVQNFEQQVLGVFDFQGVLLALVPDRDLPE